MLLLLFTVTVGVYCSSLIEITLKPAVVGVDDRGVFQYLLNHRLTFNDIFFVRNPGKYYRPFLALTFLIDQKLWGETIFGYRLTSVVLHACNTLLVYAIGMFLFNKNVHRDRISFAAALLFAVHPLAVESVAWISGRTDLLVAFWSLLAFYLYLSATEKNTIYTLPFSLACALAAALSKETGIIVFILIIGWEVYYRKNFGLPKMEFAWIFALLLVSAGILYFVLRFNALATKDMSAEMLSARIFSGGLPTTDSFFASFGYYFKKFFIPFPLQFAVDSINVIRYLILGGIIIFLFVITLNKPSMAHYHFFYFWTLLGLLPAAAVSLTDIAWTPWAERYLYFSLVPLSFISGLLFIRFINNCQNFSRKVAIVCAAIVLIIFAFSSVQRAHVWNDNLALAHDTFKKSPTFIPAAVQYACSLHEKGRRDEAEQQLHKAELLPGAKHQVFYQLGLISMNKGAYERAKRYFLYALAEARIDKKLVLMGPYVKKNILTSLSNIEIVESNSHNDKRTKDCYYKKAVGYLVQAYNEDPGDSFLLYNIGKLYLFTRNKAEAIKYFEEFIKKWNNNDIYSQTAQKLLKKLSSGVS